MRKEDYFVFVTFTIGMVAARSTNTNVMFPGVKPPKNSELSSPILPSQSTCGKVQVVSDRILGGDQSLLGDWPWMVAIGYKTKSNDKLLWSCGGTLITDRHVITAATCVANIGQLVPYVVRLGDLDLDPNVYDEATPLDVPIEGITKHERYYQDKKHVNDIAILKLKNSVTFTEFIQPICLPIAPEMKNIDLENKTAFATGWGSVGSEPGAPANTKLMQIEIPVTTSEECKRAYANIESAVIDHTVLCAGLSDGQKDTCQGDSGGPLMVPKENQYYLMGVTSYGPAICGKPGHPGVYTKVQYFVDWILEKINA